MDAVGLFKSLGKGFKTSTKTEKHNQEIKKGQLAKITLMNSLCGIVNEFYSEANNLSVPDEYNQHEKSPFDEPSKLVSQCLKFPTHKLGVVDSSGKLE